VSIDLKIDSAIEFWF